MPYVGSYKKQKNVFHDRAVYFNNDTKHYLFYAGVSRSWVVSAEKCFTHMKLILAPEAVCDVPEYGPLPVCPLLAEHGDEVDVVHVAVLPHLGRDSTLL